MHTDAPSLRIRYHHDDLIWEYLEQDGEALTPQKVAALGCRIVFMLEIAD